MIGMIGLLGCIAGSVLAAISIVVTVVSVANSADQSKEQARRVKQNEDLAKENQTQQDLMAERRRKQLQQETLSLAAKGIMSSKINAERYRWLKNKKVEKLKKENDGYHQRTERNAGTPLITKSNFK